MGDTPFGKLLAGRHGKPLSEDLEFWRAIPESALEWIADEFDLPPAVLSQEEEEEMEFLQGAGLLCAFGMPL